MVGSERAKKTHTSGAAMHEGIQINLSLTALGKVKQTFATATAIITTTTTTVSGNNTIVVTLVSTHSPSL